MPQLTGHDVRDALQQAYCESIDSKYFPVKTWEQFNSTGQAIYERMAALLNEKLQQKPDQPDLKTILAAISLQEEASFYLSATMLEKAKRQELLVQAVSDMPGSIFVGVRHFFEAVVFPPPDAITDEERENFKEKFHAAE